ncbi:HD domain-containing protein, partial [Acidobacteria bacterium AH-259-D05]|nr:HD domain-containing protein [Acidobacteria bacterium AH-259-D05]
MRTVRLKDLAQIGIALSAEKDLNKLLEMIVDESRNLTNADGGTLYILDTESRKLRFEILQNETMKMRMGGTSGTKITFPAVPLEVDGQPNHANVSSYVALTEEIVNIADIYQAEGFDFSGAKTYDASAGYRSKSILVIPMKNHEEKVIGVLQLVNATDSDNGEVIPFDPHKVDSVASLASQAAVALTNRQLIEDLTDAKQLIEEAHLDTIQRLAIVAEYKDEDTAVHIRRMSRYCGVLARALNMPPKEVELILHASPMHDVGKIGIPDAVLLKPGKLDAEEWNIMKQHTIMGAQILSGSQSELIQAGQVIALSHHEKWDGSGYPNGLAKEDIPLFGRICAVADVFDALTSKRPYKDAFPNEKAYKILEEGRGKHFDEHILEVFFKRLDEVL